jgi:hypothetical protein
MSTTTIECHVCHQPTPQSEAQPFGLLVPSGIFENGRPVWRATDQTIYECRTCWFKELEREAASAN